MLKNKVYRICFACEINHFENCESCYGFGVYKISTNPSGTFPVTAAEAHDKQFKGAVLPCPECGSTEKGCPTLRAVDPPSALVGGGDSENSAGN
jgi:hypothetical protein